MDEDESQQFSLRWHNHQSSIIGSLGRVLNSGAFSDVTLSANGTSVKAHRLILASCSQYFDKLFKDIETENNTLVVVLGCEAIELRLLLTFMYTGEVTASKQNLPSLLRLAQTLKVSGLTDANTNSTFTSKDSELVTEQSSTYANLETVKDIQDCSTTNNSTSNSPNHYENSQNDGKLAEYIGEYSRTEKDRLSKLDQIVQNLYSTHKITNPITAMTPPLIPNLTESLEPFERKWRSNTSVCGVCNKRLSNQYNLRVHMETHAGRRHACRACSHVSRSRDALRKHVAYRHAPNMPSTTRAHRTTTTTSRLDG
ncbi:Protein tramtrack, alpha isoform [Papilio machaon]|uniref:Protein tramtrack, alpha isoform n=1 Tax=Papilio machaon TaxID=76193 RepID=A0A194RPM7_PAPMA|nr:Protein tramtrack, alpha isoform [Papilio machaon]